MFLALVNNSNLSTGSVGMQSLLVMRCLIIAESDLPIHTRVNTEQDEAKHYIGLAETSFKVRYANRETSVYNENTGAALSY